MNLQNKLDSAINSLRICEKFPAGIRSDEIKQIADELETILAELGRLSTRKLEQCPDGCYRPKATSADDCAAGCCSKWYAVRDKEASAECEKLAAFWKRPPALGELSDEQWYALLNVMDAAAADAASINDSWEDINKNEIKAAGKAAREFLGKVDG